MAVTGHGARFTFDGVEGAVSGLEVTAPKADLVDMTGGTDLAGATTFVESGDHSSPGTIAVEFVAGPGADPQTLVRQRGPLVFSSPGITIVRNVICDGATISARTGETVRGTLSFTMTDYYG